VIDFGLHTRRALVAGAGQGIGRACVLALHAAGAQVACVDTEATRADAVAAEVTTTGGVARSHASRRRLERWRLLSVRG
jgi:NAD(P)-dependent dehydrogenase (short-subunit alcohol dehydrogenase family)